MQRWAAGAPSPDVAIPAEPIRCLGRVLWGRQKRLDSVWVSVDGFRSFGQGFFFFFLLFLSSLLHQTREIDAMQSRACLLARPSTCLCDSNARR